MSKLWKEPLDDKLLAETPRSGSMSQEDLGHPASADLTEKPIVTPKHAAHAYLHFGIEAGV